MFRLTRIFSCFIFSFICCQTSVTANDVNPHPWTLEFRDSTMTAVIKETGEVTVKHRWYGDKWLNKEGTVDEQDKTNLFKLAAEPAFQNTKAEYLQMTWHQLILRDANGKLIHQVIHRPDISLSLSNSQSIEPVPKIVNELELDLVGTVFKTFPSLVPPPCGGG